MNISSFICQLVSSASAYPDGIFSKRNGMFTFINPYSYHIMRKHPDLYSLMDGLFVDGMTMCFWLRLLWRVRIPRLSFDMTSMAKDLFECLNKSGESIYFIGAKKDEIRKSVDIIRNSYPKIHVAGFRDGYFSSREERDMVIMEIININPRYLVIGMGSPLQEQFSVDVRAAGYKGTSFTCGGFLHQTADGINYYPVWVDRYNLRGVYRSFMEKGVMKRNYNTFIQFPALLIFDTFSTKIKKWTNYWKSSTRY